MIHFWGLQQRFEEMWALEQKVPLSVSIAEADYDGFFESMYPKYEWSALERELLGEDRCAEFEARREETKANVRGIINYVNGEVVPLLRNPTQSRGVIVYNYRREVLIETFRA